MSQYWVTQISPKDVSSSHEKYLKVYYPKIEERVMTYAMEEEQRRTEGKLHILGSS